MGTIQTALDTAFRDYTVAGVPASGDHDPVKSEIRGLGPVIETAIGAAAAGITIVSNIAARDAFFATPANQGKLAYVNNNNGSSSDAANGVYEYVGGAARLAQGFYAGVASVVQPLVTQAQDAATAAVAASAGVRSPNILFDSFNRYTYQQPQLGGWNWYNGSAAITWSTASANIPVKTPVAQVAAGATGFRKSWDTSKLAGFRAGEVLRVSALAYATNAGGAALYIYVRDGSGTNLVTALPAMSGAAGLQVLSANVTIPAGHATLLIVVLGASSSAVEVGAICATLGAQQPQISSGPVDADYFLAWLNGSSLDARFAQYATNTSLDGVMPRSKNLFNPADADVALGNFILNTSGVPTANAGYNATGFIPVTAGMQYTSSYTGQYAFYNSSKVYISGVNATAAATPVTFTVPAGAAYVRFSVATTSWALYQLEAGAAATSHQAFGRTLAPSAFDGVVFGTSRLANGAVTPEKTSFFLASKNLFNPADADVALGNFVNYANGVVSANALYNTTGFVPVTAGAQYTLSYSHQRAFYNASKVYIAGTNSGNPATFTAPVGAAYARFTVALASWPTFQVEAGAVATTYEPYGSTLDPAFIPDAVWDAISSGLGDHFNAATLRNYHYLREKRVRAVPEAARSHIALCGDSFTHIASRYSGGFAASEMLEQGDGGAGWVGFGFATAGTLPYAVGGNQPVLLNGNVRSSYTVQFVGSGWTSSYGTVPSPDACCATSSTAGNRIVIGIPATAGANFPALSAIDLFWIGTANGVARYSWDNGATWTNLNVQGTVGDCSFAALAGASGGGGAQTLIVEVVSGTCSIAGCHPISAAASGVIVHKLGATGRRAMDFATVALNASWGASLARLGITTFEILHGTNDQGSSRTPAQFSSDVQNIGNAVLAAIPGCDIAVFMPPENQRTTNSVAMKALAAAAAIVANDNDWSFCNTQRDFGSPDAPTVYGSAGARPLFNPDLVHPEPVTGGRSLESGHRRFYRYAS